MQFYYEDKSKGNSRNSRNSCRNLPQVIVFRLEEALVVRLGREQSVAYPDESDFFQSLKRICLACTMREHNDYLR